MISDKKQNQPLLHSYRNYVKSKYLYLVICAILLLFLLVAGIGIGPTSIGWDDILYRAKIVGHRNTSFYI